MEQVMLAELVGCLVKEILKSTFQTMQLILLGLTGKDKIAKIEATTEATTYTLDPSTYAMSSDGAIGTLSFTTATERHIQMKSLPLVQHQAIKGIS
jgi:hypothetical protein